MADPVPPRPGLHGIADRIAGAERGVLSLRAPNGTQRFRTTDELAATVAYLAGLTTTVVQGSNVTVSKANDGNFAYYATTAIISGLQVPTGRLLVSANVGEMRLSPGGSSNVQGLVLYSVKDALGVTVPGAALAAPGRYGRLLFGLGTLYAPIKTPEIPLIIDPVVSPGPYTVSAFLGAFVFASDTASRSFTFNDISLRADVLAAA